MLKEYNIIDDYVEIYVYNKKGEKFTGYIDLEDLNKVLDYPYNFHVGKNNAGYYLCATSYKNKKENKKVSTVRLHRFIMDADSNDYIDHRNNNTLDNRKKNLRKTTNKDNLKNRKGKNSNNKSGYRNVCWSKGENKWLVQLQIEGRGKRLGTFDDVHEAGEFAERMRKKYYGEYKGKS